MLTRINPIPFFLCLCLLICQPALAEIELTHAHQSTIANILERITAEKKRNDILEKQITKRKNRQANVLDQFAHETLDKQTVDREQFNYTVSMAEVISAQQLADEARLELEDLKQALKRAKLRYQERLLKEKSDSEQRAASRLSNTIEFLNLLVTHHEDLVRLLEQSLSLTEKLSELDKAFYEQLLTEYNNQQSELRENDIASLNRQNQVDQSKWLKNLYQLTEKLDMGENLKITEKIFLQLKILEAEEEIALLTHKLKIAKFHDKLEDIYAGLINLHSVQGIDSQIHHLTPLKNDLLALNNKLSAKQHTLLTQEKIQKRYFDEGMILKKQYVDNLKILNHIESQYQSLIEIVENYFTRLNTIQKLSSKKMSEAIGSRQGLPGTDLDAWKNLLTSMSLIPLEGWNLITNLYKHVILSYEVNGWSVLGVGLSVASLLMFLILFLRHYFDIILPVLAGSRSRLTSNVFFIILQIIRRNLWGMYIVIGTLLFLYWIELPFNYYQFIAELSIVWFSYSAVHQFARLCLVETISDVAGQDVRLFKQLNRALIIGGIITVVAVLAKLLKLPYETQDLISRFLMLFMFAIAAVLLWGNYVFPDLFKQIVGTKRPYLLRSLNLLSFLIPLNVLIIAVVGLIGYVQLAWRMSYYQIIFVLVLTLYTMIRGFVSDLMEFVADYMIRYSRNGWLFTEAILKPVDRILHLCIILLSGLLLFHLYGWNKESLVVENLFHLIYYPFVTFKGGQISLLSIFEFGFLLAIVIWATRWAYEFSYRLMFYEIRDPGLRKSFSTFFQYAIAMLGILPTLWILGIDFTGLSMILSALAIGLGFGLRDLANNFVCGIFLLIERPVKEGDLVSIGGYEGRVTHVGLRSMRVKSWDHTEVMVPNSEAFNKAFLNWTYHDSVVRSIIIIRIHRRDDPIYVQSLVLDILGNIEEVRKDPEPTVLLKEIDDVLVQFEIRYFIDVNRFSRMGTRSKVLFAIWQRFKACGIRPPYPQQDIKLIEADHS